MRVRTADAVTWLRLLLLPVIWVLAMLGHGRLVGAGLVLAGVTDFLDGYLARRLGQESSAGARLDAIADRSLPRTGDWSPPPQSSTQRH
ncbi:MAG: CDP-alcohol phosphatidyltransferase family protein [Chloroflexi bacterium]|nr:MAG: CDP-alcohol phosphatidyltransferase family protein [Chloroflexota bacterium]